MDGSYHHISHISVSLAIWLNYPLGDIVQAGTLTSSNIFLSHNLHDLAVFSFEIIQLTLIDILTTSVRF